MSNYLRDRHIRSVSLDEDRIRNIHGCLVEIANINNENIDAADPKFVDVKVMIRFDSKGFLLSDIDEVIGYYKSAKRTERFNFVLESGQSRASNRASGKAVDLWFDALNELNCILRVQDDDKTWAESTFCKLEEEIDKYGNMNFIIRTAWTPFVVQILGVTAGVLLSLWAALRISPYFEIQYPFVASFVLAFLIFSNIWTYLNSVVLKFLDYAFPNISIRENRGLRWLFQTFLATIVVAAAVYFVDRTFDFFGRIVSEILK